MRGPATAMKVGDHQVGAPVVPGARRRATGRLVRGILAAAALALVAALAWLARLEHLGPAHAEIELPGGIPATFYVQGESSPFGLPIPPPPGERPPAIVLCHGFSADRAMMSTLARRLAANGYGVLAIDARGHGENRHRFHGGGDGAGLHQEFATAVDYLRHSPQVDGARIGVVGHSMGAGASLAYATRDPEIVAAVMISGGFRLEGAQRPANALFIYAEHDPADLRHASDALAKRLGHDGAGGFADRTAVHVSLVPGQDHLSILWSKEAAGEIVEWLDRSFGIERDGAPALAEPRLTAVALAFALFLLVLPGIGWWVGSLAPVTPRQESGSRLASLGVLSLALVAVLPLSASHVMTAPLSLPVAQEVASFFLSGGLVLIAGMIALGHIEPRRLVRECGRATGAALLGGLAIAAAMTPLGVAFHRLGLTPERAMTAVLLLFAFLPLYLALELLLRRGAPLAAAIASAAGRITVIAVIFLGIALGLLPWVIALMLPVVVAIFILGEVVAWPIYAVSGNRLAIALVQAGWFAWLVAATMATRL